MLSDHGAVPLRLVTSFSIYDIDILADERHRAVFKLAVLEP